MTNSASAPNVFILAVIAEKGGVGKTMLACTMASIAAKKKKKVALLDLDPQPTATNWHDRRELHNVNVISCQVARLKENIKNQIDNGANFIVIDTAGKASDAAIAAARAASFVLIPIQASVSSIETLTKVRDVLELAGMPPYSVVVNDAPMQGQRHIETQEIIRDEGFEIAPTVIHHRVLHGDAANLGSTSVEVDEKSKAAGEVLALYDYILKTHSKIKKG